jgi:hypothetical protein
MLVSSAGLSSMSPDRTVHSGAATHGGEPDRHELPHPSHGCRRR